MPPLSRHFRERYLESLGYYKYFYDDLATYGSPSASNAFYFVPGFNGVSGQIRFVFPSLLRRFGADVYVKSLYLPEFSARRPIWDKYTTKNVDLKRHKVASDLIEMLGRFDRVTVLCSSSGFYDFAGAVNQHVELAAERRLRVVWAPCASDQYLPSAWEKVFFALNGLVESGFRWFAYPNHWSFRWITPEATSHYRWRYERQTRRFYKNEIESRFFALGLPWDYISIDCFAAMTEHMNSFIERPLELETHVLVAKNDGYWQGRTPEEIDAVLRRYLANYRATYKDASHLWVMTPENFFEVLDGLPDPAREGRATDAASP